MCGRGGWICDCDRVNNSSGGQLSRGHQEEGKVAPGQILLYWASRCWQKYVALQHNCTIGNLWMVNLTTRVTSLVCVAASSWPTDVPGTGQSVRDRDNPRLDTSRSTQRNPHWIRAAVPAEWERVHRVFCQISGMRFMILSLMKAASAVEVTAPNQLMWI